MHHKLGAVAICEDISLSALMCNSIAANFELWDCNLCCLFCALLAFFCLCVFHSCAAHKICELNLYLKFPLSFSVFGNWQLEGSKLPNKPKHFVCTNLRLTFGRALSAFCSFHSAHHRASSILFITANFKLELKF